MGLLVRLAEAGAALVIFLGAVQAFVGFVRLARFLALGLEFQLASDLLRTAVAPSFEEIGKLPVTAAGVLTLLAAPVYGLKAALRLALDFWMAAGLLHLSASPTWSALGVAAVILGIQRLVQIRNPFANAATTGPPRTPD